LEIGEILLDQAVSYAGVSEEWLTRARADRTFLNYHRLWRELEGGSGEEPHTGTPRIRVALLGNVTLEPLARYLTVACLAEGITPSIYLSPYGQHTRDILDPASALYAASPDLAILLLDRAELLPELSPAGLERGLSLMQSFIAAFEKNSRGTLLAHNLTVPTRTAASNLELRNASGEVRLTRRFNESLAEACSASPRAFVIDLESRLSEFGKRAALDDRMNHIGRLPFAVGFVPELTHEYLGYVKAARGRTRKCLVVDADNTLWGGVVGEVGREGIALGPTAPGSVYLAFQRLLLDYFRRGVILALNSRNNPDDLFDVLDNHPDQLLRREHFAAIRANWQTKSQNLAEIAAELNIGVDSMVFVDDDPVNRAEVRAVHPDVLVVELQKDPSSYPSALLALNDWCALGLTDEDMRRGELYASARLRKEAMAALGDADDYFHTLQMQVTLSDIDDFAVPRASQLCLRTNQFNATTRRHTAGDIERLRSAPDWILLSASLRDRFGDSGMVGLCFAHTSDDLAEIDTLLMSCRALGRGVEDALLVETLRRARRRGARRCRVTIRFTPKNAPVRDYFPQRGFTLVAADAEQAVWELELSDLRLAPPQYLAVAVAGETGSGPDQSPRAVSAQKEPE
jgi:FkbH-like protein